MALMYHSMPTSRRAHQASITQNDHLVVEHVVHGIGDSARSVAGSLVAGKGHPVGAKGGVVIQHNCGSFKMPCGEEGRIDVAREDRSLKGERKAVGPANGVGKIIESIHAGDRTEDLV